MATADPPLRRRTDRELRAYVVLAFGLSWAYWVPVALAGGQASHAPGLLGPLLAGVLVSVWSGDGRAFVRRLLRWRTAPRWYAVALVPLAAGAVAVGLRAVTGSAPSGTELADLPGLPSAPWLVVLLLVLVVNGFGEEGGWRGFAWPRLRERRGLPDAALVLTVVWALWHLPVFWIDSGLGDLPLVLVPGWLVGLAAGAVVLGWLYERSGAVLVVALAHTTLNMMSATRGGEGLVSVVVTTVVVVGAVAVLRAARRQEAVS